MSSRDTKPKKKSRPKLVLEPISIDEILSGPGMSGFVSILEPREEVPHLQALVDDIQGPALRAKLVATAKHLPWPASDVGAGLVQAP